MNLALPFGPVCDFSGTHPSDAQLTAKGYTDVCRYVVPPDHVYDWKRLTKAELDHHHSQGRGVVANFETSTGRPNGGAANGEADGRAFAAAMQVLGFPPGTAAYLSYDEYPGSWSAYSAYYRAAGNVLAGEGYSPGAGYMGSVAANPLMDAGVIKWFWQACAMSWSVGWAVSPRAHLVQKVVPLIPGTDHNVRQAQFIGAWRPEGVDYLVGAAPAKPRWFNSIVEDD